LSHPGEFGDAVSVVEVVVEGVLGRPSRAGAVGTAVHDILETRPASTGGVVW